MTDINKLIKQLTTGMECDCTLGPKAADALKALQARVADYAGEIQRLHNPHSGHECSCEICIQEPVDSSA